MAKKRKLHIASPQKRRLSEYIYNQIERHKINQSDLARTLNVSTSYLSMVCLGRVPSVPSIEFLDNLAEAFGDSKENVYFVAGAYDKQALNDYIDKNPDAALFIRKLINDEISIAS